MVLPPIMEEDIPGNFNFLPDHNIYEYDYRIINKIGNIAWEHLKIYSLENHDFVIEHILTLIYPAHTVKTRKQSLEYLVFIAKYGWDNFVKQFKK